MALEHKRTNDYFKTALARARSALKMNLPKSEIQKKENGHLIPTGVENDEDASPLMNRIEDKYLLPRKNLGKVTDILRARLGQGDIDTSARYNHNTTIYMDNRDMVSYRDGLARVIPRFKARIRRYATDNGEKEDVAYVELKMKTDDEITRKIRLRIPASAINRIADGGELQVTPRLVDDNRDISKDKLWHRVALFNTVIGKYGLKKHLSVEYDRRAFSNNKVRVTIDDAVKYKAYIPLESDVRNSILKSKPWRDGVKQVSKLTTGEWLIMEVKHEENVPVWLEDLIAKSEAKKVKISKYVCAVTKQILFGQEGYILPPHSVYEEKDMEKSEKYFRSLLKLRKDDDGDLHGQVTNSISDYMARHFGGDNNSGQSTTTGSAGGTDTSSAQPAANQETTSAFHGAFKGEPAPTPQQAVIQQPVVEPNPLRHWKVHHDPATGMVHFHHSTAGVMTVKKQPRAKLRGDFPYAAAHNGKNIGRYKTIREAVEGVARHAKTLNTQNSIRGTVTPQIPGINDMRPPMVAKKSEDLEKRSKNVREQTRNITPEKRAGRMNDLIRRMGFYSRQSTQDRFGVSPDQKH